MEDKSESVRRLGSFRTLQFLVRQPRVMISPTNAVRSLLVSMSWPLLAPALAPGGENLKTKRGAPVWRRDGSGREAGGRSRGQEQEAGAGGRFSISHLSFANSSWKCNRTLFVASPQRGEMFIAWRSFL